MTGGGRAIVLGLGLLTAALFLASCAKTLGERELLPGVRPGPGYRPSRPPDLEVPVDGATLRGYSFLAPGNRVVVVYFGGNEELLDADCEVASLAARHRFDAYAVSYRGYGPSDGSPSLDAFASDGLAIFDAIAARPEVAGRPIVVFGNSLGSAIALLAAARRGVAGVVLRGAPTSAAEVIPAMRGLLPWPLRLVTRLRASDRLADWKPQPIDLAPSVRAPLLSLHGRDDRIVPARFGRKVFEAAASPDKRFCEVRGVGHNDFWDASGEVPHACLEEFLRGVERRAAE